MAGITLEQAQAKLDESLAALSRAMESQRYQISAGDGSSRSQERPDLGMLQRQVEFWDAKVRALTPVGSGGRRRVHYIVPEQ